MSWFGRQRGEPSTDEQRAHDPCAIVRAYHERSKHGFQRPAAGPHGLDWSNQPDAFRRWRGTPWVALERDGGGAGPSWRAAMAREVPAEPLTRATLSRFFYDSLALSAWKQAGDTRWALRVNPSSGNLHPTEAHALLPALAGIAESASVQHYAPREHGLERRAAIPPERWRKLAGPWEDEVFFVGLTSIHWRESWKYGERAFRYCQHDAGHALAALSVAAAGLGWRASLVDELGTRELAGWLGTHCSQAPEHEVADVLLRIESVQRASEARSVDPDAWTLDEPLEWLGEPSALSPEHVDWEVIEVVSDACEKPAGCSSSEPHTRPAPTGDDPRAPESEPLAAALRTIVRTRRSAVAMDGATTMEREAFARLLEDLLPRPQAPPFDALAWRPRIHLALFVHRVEGLTPGLYWLARDADSLERTRAACRPEFDWQRPAGMPADLPLYLLHEGDVRGLATRLSCQQEIAGQGVFSLGMIADFESSLEQHGAWFYPRLFWEAGALGQRLYLEAEVHGLRGTGIGCYFDDPVHATLGLRDRSWQSLYHFTVGGAVDDARLRSSPAYDQVER